MVECKRMIFLGLSRMWGGYCAGGIELDHNGNPGNWIRLVFATDKPAIPADKMQYPDGNFPELLDIVEVPVVKHCPEKHQQENWLLNNEEQWKKISTFPRSRLIDIAKTEGSLWHVEGEQTRRVSPEGAKDIQHSIEFVCAANFKIRKVPQERWSQSLGYYTVPQYRADFVFSNNTFQNLVVTDPKFKTDVACSMPPMDKVYLTVSLTMPYYFGEYCYKLVAAVLEP